MREYKIGDKVKVTMNMCSHGAEIGKEYMLSRRSTEKKNTWRFSGFEGNYYITEDEFELVTNKKNMSIKDNFTLAFKKEPEKSFRKTGITNGDDFLTEDGQHVFLSWLLKKHGEEFKKEVVDDLLAQQEKENSK